MKKCFLFLIAVALLFAMCSCFASKANATNDVPIPLQMEKIARCNIDSDDCIDYYRDTITDVMYVCFTGYRKAGLTEMHDPETGLPLTYARYMEIYNSLQVKE